LERTTNAGQTTLSLANSEITSDDHSAQSTPSSTISEAQRRMSLYFALCTKV